MNISASAFVEVNEDGQIVLTIDLTIDGENRGHRDVVINRAKSKVLAEEVFRAQGMAPPAC